MEPLKPTLPHIKKSTAITIIRTLFPEPAQLLERFELVRKEAGIWDGERDGLREAVKQLPAGQYDNVILSWTETAPVLYPNSEGKYQLEHCLQTTIPAAGAMGHVIAFQTAEPMNANQFLDKILHLMQGGKEQAVNYLNECILGQGTVVENENLYEKKGSDKSSIVILPKL